MQRLDVLPVLKSQQTCHSMEHDDKGQQEPLSPFHELLSINNVLSTVPC